MKIILSFCLILVTSSVFCQSKKELAAEVARLKNEATQLKSESADLKNQLEKFKSSNVIGLDSDQKKASYGVGVLIASNLKAQGGDSLDLATINAGIADIYLNNQLKIEKQECSGYVQSYLQKAMSRKMTVMKEEGTVFLQANKVKPGIMTTATGLQYKVVTAGKGKKPGPTDEVTVHYAGKTLDGTEVDSSHKGEGKPVTFRIDGVIAGWTEALQLMHEGDKWMLYIPSELAYGERGSGPLIPPYSTLIFEVELIKVN